MPNPLNVPITPPRVAFIDPRSGTVSREWYLFFLSLFQSQGGSTISLDDVQKGPPALTIDEINVIVDKASENLRPSTESTVEQIAELRKQIEALEVQVRPELGTMSQLQQDNVPWLQFDTTPSGMPTGANAHGTLYWDDADGIKTLNLVMEDSGGVVQQIGEETYYRIKADAAITNGQVVMFTGTVGASGALKGAPATGLTAFQNEYIMGVATQDIANNGWGYVTWFGLVRGINTTGGAEAWVDGQILYYDPAVPGGLTKNVPTAPNPKVIVASVVNAASNGSLFVRPTFGSALGATDSNVQIGTLANGNLLIYNASTSRWENATLTAGTNVTITNGPGSITIASSNPGGTVTSVGLSAPTGFSVSGSPVTSSGTLALSFASGYSLPTTASQTNWDTAYTDRLKWDGGSTGLVAATGRTSLGATTVGSNLFTLTNPSAVTFLRVNADNTVSALDAATFRTAIGAGTGNGSVTSVAMTVPTGLSISGSPITTSGTLALTLTSGYSIPTTSSQTNWDTAYTDRLKWDGGSTGLVAATGRTSLGLGTMATQNASSVAITGGTIDGVTIGATAGTFAKIFATNTQVNTTTPIYHKLGTNGFSYGGGSQDQATIVEGAWFIDGSTASDIAANFITSGAAWRMIMIGSWGNYFEGFGVNGPANYLEVTSASNTFAVGSRTVTVTRNSTTGNLQWVSNTYGCMFQGFIHISQSAGTPANSIQVKGQIAGTVVYPIADNTHTLGTAGARWSVVYAGNGTINTSDGNEKQDVAELSDAEKRVAVRIKNLIRKYRFRDAIALKGDSARTHFGAVAQQVQEAFANEGLDATEYGVFCMDRWYELNGEPVGPNAKGVYPDGAVEVVRYGLRYDQLLALTIAGM